MSVEDWFVSLAAERIRDREVTERFFSRVPQPDDGQKLLEILASTNDDPPMPGDEFEP